MLAGTQGGLAQMPPQRAMYREFKAPLAFLRAVSSLIHPYYPLAIQTSAIGMASIYVMAASTVSAMTNIGTSSRLITSNLPFDEWTETLGSERLTGALLDRITHNVNILEMNGDSYRLAQSRARKAG